MNYIRMRYLQHNMVDGIFTNSNWMASYRAKEFPHTLPIMAIKGAMFSPPIHFQAVYGLLERHRSANSEKQAHSTRSTKCFTMNCKNFVKVYAVVPAGFQNDPSNILHRLARVAMAMFDFDFLFCRCLINTKKAICNM